MISLKRLDVPPAKGIRAGRIVGIYYQSLVLAEEIERRLGDEARAIEYKTQAVKFKKAFHTTLYDERNGLYFDGLNDDYKPNEWLPTNVSKRYYGVHTNSLAVLYGLCPDNMAAKIMEKVLKDDTLIKPQLYFMHFVLCAIDKCGLFASYGLEQIRR